MTATQDTRTGGRVRFGSVRTAPHGDTMKPTTEGVRVIVIPDQLGEPIREQRIEKRNDSCYRALNELCEGMIEGLPFPGDLTRSYPPGEGPQHDVAGVYINEEGKFEMPGRVNERATTLMFKGGLLFPGDWIAGPFVIAGTDPRNGETIDCPADVTVEAIERQTRSL